MPVAKRSRKRTSSRTPRTRKTQKRSKQLTVGGNVSDVQLQKIEQLALNLTASTDMLFVQYPLSSLRNTAEYQAPASDSLLSLRPADNQMIGKSIDQVGLVQSVQEVVDIPPNTFTVLITNIPQLPGQQNDIWRAYVRKSYQDDFFDEFELLSGPQGTEVTPTGITARYLPTSPKQVMTQG